MKNLQLITASLAFFFSQCHSQTNNQPVAVSKDYMKIISQQCAKPDIIEVEYTPDGYVEIEYFCDGKRYEIGIKDNTLLFSEHAMKQEEIPLDKINRKLEKKYQGWTIDEVAQVSVNDTTFIKIEILKDGIEQNVYFTNDGKWFKIKAIDITSTFDPKSIQKSTVYQSAKYKFHQPDSTYEMPDLLKEISGLALGSENNIYCVQDEIGSIFEYELKKQEIIKSHRFTDIGDFEDVAINKNTLYVLRSDGNIFVYDLKNKTKTSQSMLQINSLNIEGICHNGGYIYIACKDALVNQHETKRMVYRVNANKLNNIEPYLEINADDLSKFITSNYPETGISNIHFNPSAIAIHPVTKEMYVLSATDRFIAIYKEKQLKNVIPLVPEIYYKPEGLSFYENGDLLISSEGDKKGFVKGTINLLKYK